MGSSVLWVTGARCAALLALVAAGALSMPLRAQVAAADHVGQLSSQAAAQSGIAAPLKFEVVSIRRNMAEMGPDTARVDFRPDGDGLTMTDIVLSSIVSGFYGHWWDTQAGMPDWAKQECYDLRTKVEDADVAAYQKLTNKQRTAMVQAVLEERFKLRTHMEQREAPIYELVVAKGGPKFKEAPAGEVYTSGPKGLDGKFAEGTVYVSGDGENTAHAASMTMFAGTLNSLAGRQVVDRTGLGGGYDFTFKWEPSADGPSLFTALEEQLGLSLRPAKGMVQTLVIDHLERPSEN